MDKRNVFDTLHDDPFERDPFDTLREDPFEDEEGTR